MTQEIFDQQITLSLRRLEQLWRRVDELPKPPTQIGQQAEEFPEQQQELLKESWEELSIFVEELQVAAQELRQQNEELAKSRMALEAERDRYQELFEFAPDGYLMTNQEGTILDANQTAAQLLNVSQKLLFHKPLVVFVAAEERQDFYSKLTQLQKGESINNWQVQMQRRHGGRFTASLTVAPVQSPEGQVVSLRWRLLNLTPTQNGESTRPQSVQISPLGRDANGHENSAAPADEHRLFYAMFENAAVGIVLLDNQGRVIKSNPALQEMLGYTEQELHTVLPELLNLDKVGVESAMFQQLMAGERRSYQREKRFFHQDASVQWGRLTFSLVQGDCAQAHHPSGDRGESAFATCMLEDITEQKHLKEAQQQSIKQQQAIKQQREIEQLEASIQEQKNASNQPVETKPQPPTASVEQLGNILNDILSSSPEFFFICDQTGKYIYLNRAAAQAFGVAQSDFIGKTWRQLNLPAEIMERWDAQREVVFTTGQSITDEASLPTVEGIRDYEYTISLINEINSSPKAVVVTARDITEQKWAAVASSEALAREEEFSVLKAHFSSFASAIAQELRNPLNNIFSCAKLIESNTHQETDETKLNYLQLIQVNARRINQLLNDLLLIKKVEARELRLNPGLLDLTEFCRELAQELKRGVGREHRLIFSSQGECSSACMDKKLLGRILTNLLLNGIKYSPKGSEVKLDVVCQEEQAIFRIQDFGIGIPQDDQEFLFKAFHRGTNVGTVTGSGLGLLIVKQCVDLQEGEILVESEEGVGTTVTVMLPLNQQQLQSD
jgi:PAS domain S-box-containing protein